MANIKDFIKKIGNETVSLEEQQKALAAVEQTIVEAKAKREESIGKNVDLVISALKKIESDLEAKLVELNNTPAKQGVAGPKGEKGRDGRDGKDGYKGQDGKDGVDGQDGKDGSDGVSVTDAKVDFDGSLVITLSDGREIDAGTIVSLDVAKNIHSVQTAGTGSTSQAVLDAIAAIQATIATYGTMATQNANAVAITGGTINGTVIGGTTPAAITGTTLGIDTSGTDAQIAPNTGITGWDYSGLSKSISAEESAPTGLFLSPDGLNMYVNGSTGDDVNQYTLSTAWNVSTATYVRVFSTAAQDTSPQDVFFKPNGLSMYIMGATNDTVYQYTLSSAFDISTASYASKSFSVTSQETSPTGLWFKPDGTVMYVIGSNADTVFQYILSTAWDVSTASYASISFSVSTQESSPAQVNLSADGLTMWILGSTGDDINQYSLGTAWNVSTAVFVNSFYVGFEDTTPSGLFIDSTANNRVYFVGGTNDTVFQYNTATNSISAVTDVFNATSNARVQGNLAVQGSVNIDTTLTAQGSLNTASNITASGTISVAASATFSTTTGNIAIGNSQTSGSWTAGGASGTGTITVGQSTVSQTTNIQAGITASGSTKTMNIGTSGASGSTTNIAIGSTTGTSTTTLNGALSLQNALPVLQGGTGVTTSTGTGAVVLGTRPTLSVTGAGLTLQDATDNTKQAQFSLANITTGTTRTYTLPDSSSTFVLLNSTATFSGTLTFSSATQNYGSSTATGTQQLAYGATISGATKTVNIGTGGVSGSTTTITIGSSTGTTTTTFNGVTKQQNYTVATLPSASTSGVGARSFVTDALAPTFGSTVVTGGAIAVPVYSDGTNWKVG